MRISIVLRRGNGHTRKGNGTACSHVDVELLLGDDARTAGSVTESLLSAIKG
jgi:hypothetical protein